MKNKCIGLCLVLCCVGVYLVMTFGLVACTILNKFTGLEYTLDEETDTYILSDCKSNHATIKIPTTYNGKAVTAIGERAFEKCYKLRSITIPESITEIGAFSFYECWALTSVTIPESVTTINEYTFYRCLDLAEVKLGSKVTTIEEYAFDKCSSLTTITIPDSIEYVGKFAFSGCENLTLNTYDNAGYLGNADNPYVVLMKASNKSISSCVIASNTKVIYDNAFDGCTSIHTINTPEQPTMSAFILPNSLTAIGEEAFLNCSITTSISIPKSVTFIGENAFKGWDKVESVFASASCASVIAKTCKSITELYITSGTTIEKNAFRDINKYSSAVIDGRSTTIIVSTLRNVVLPDGITEIKEYAFYGAGLESITIPVSVVSIERGAIPCYTTVINYEQWRANIYYKGTKAQWDAIRKDESWSYQGNKTSYTLHCTDGDFIVE